MILNFRSQIAQKKGTGVSNELIISNFKSFQNHGYMIIRVPVIGGLMTVLKKYKK